ncbi:protein-glutamate O-methyltransferase CheR [Acerihabitans sp. TG2]|uniref:CheR family methyltransferase n=1 Tax=Acerihabitans sp. TG2 TaxID=3096008 RepID=UPI002B2272ED|nr:protein-glutamate O-methyltransferase CheR [Acerihabitans sp. TG2]MEA9393221.1 protein-glutamate O-methyltransferase CheR [Acerihabitans sp. TG2]
MADINISDDNFRKFREFFYRKTGIQFEESKRYFVDKRLLERIEKTGSETFRHYFTMLRFDATGVELQALVNLMTINETYFFREDYQFDCLVNSILPEIVADKIDDTPIRIWILPSSSGEEAYSIAMCLLERWPGISQWDVELISSDIDTKILAQARAALYTPRSVQHVPRAYLQKYFQPVGLNYQLGDDLRDAVEFTHVNLMDATDVMPYRNFDVIFCRNLLIYFDDLSRKQAAETFFDALLPGGFICLGHSESMSRISPLYKARQFPEAIVNQKVLEQK